MPSLPASSGRVRVEGEQTRGTLTTGSQSNHPAARPLAWCQLLVAKAGARAESRGGFAENGNQRDFACSGVPVWMARVGPRLGKSQGMPANQPSPPMTASAIPESPAGRRALRRVAAVALSVKAAPKLCGRFGVLDGPARRNSPQPVRDGGLTDSRSPKGEADIVLRDNSSARPSTPSLWDEVRREI
jgi:hypothetical protein